VNNQSVKRTQSFSFFFSEAQLAGEEEVDQRASEAQDRAHHAGSTPGHVVGPIWRSVSPFASFFMDTDSPRPKNAYIYHLGFYFTMDGDGDQNPRNKETLLCCQRSSEGETPPGSPSVISTPFGIIVISINIFIQSPL
jgi:hypothetical protein